MSWFSKGKGSTVVYDYTREEARARVQHPCPELCRNCLWMKSEAHHYFDQRPEPQHWCEVKYLCEVNDFEDIMSCISECSHKKEKLMCDLQCRYRGTDCYCYCLKKYGVMNEQQSETFA